MTKALRILRELRVMSNDPVTQTSALVFAIDGGIIGVGANHINYPNPTALNRTQRGLLSTHAEVVALSLIAQGRKPYSLLTLGTPCLGCAEAIVAAGVRFLGIDAECDPFKDRLDDPAYEFDRSFAALEAGGVAVQRV
jgi:tRNA(Arg) A34 adenosine deaminase TadA